MMEKVTAGATGALGQISMEGYSSSNLTTMLSKITSGATSALGDIEMEGYSSNNLSLMVEKITLALPLPSMKFNWKASPQTT